MSLKPLKPENFPVHYLELDPKTHVYIKAKGLEWHYLMGKLVKLPKLKRSELMNTFGVKAQDDGSILYMLRRDVFTPEMLYKIFGITQDQLDTGLTINLQAPDADGLPKPTVAYYGVA